MANFYDKVAKKLGGYGFANDGVVYRSEYPNSDPEEEFYNATIDSSSPHRKALDIGCGDSIFSSTYFINRFRFVCSPHLSNRKQDEVQPIYIQ